MYDIEGSLDRQILQTSGSRPTIVFVEPKDPRVIEAACQLTRFIRPVLSSMGAYPAVRVVEGGACQGCQSALRHALDKLAAEDGFAAGTPHTVYLGVPLPQAVNLRNVPGQLWCFGACAAPLAFDVRRPGNVARFVAGCPPHILDFYKAYKSVTQ